MKRFIAFLTRIFGHSTLKLDFPYTVFLTKPDVELLKTCNVIFPYTRTGSNGELAIPVSYLELINLRATVMGLAQEGIGRAARRQLATLPRRSHALGVLAGYLHSVWIATPEAIAERAQVDNVIHFPAESPPGTRLVRLIVPRGGDHSR